MGTIGKISVNLEAESAKFSKTVKGAAADINNLRTTVDRLKKQGGSNLFDNLREGLGKKSAIGEAAELLEGRGPVRGLTAAVDVLKTTTIEAHKLKEEWDSGNASAGEMAERVAKGIPVVGQFVSAGREIRAEFDGTAAALREAETESKVWDSVLKAHDENMKQLAANARSFAEYWEKAAKAMATAQAPDRDKSRIGSQYDEAAELRRLHDEREDELKKSKETNDKAIKDAEKAYSEASQNASKGGIGSEAAEESARLDMLRAQRVAVAQERDQEAKINSDFDQRELLARQTAATERMAEEKKVREEHAKAVKEAAERDNKAIRDANAAAQRDQLKTGGGMLAEDQKYAADVAELKAHLADRLDEIEKEREAESKLYNEDDAENQGKVAKVAADKAAAAQAQEIAGERAAAYDKEQAKIEQLSKVQETIAEQEKEHWDEVKRFREEAMGPLDKYKQKIEEINSMKDVPPDVLNAAKSKAYKELIGAVGVGVQENIAVTNEARRFDFTLGRDIKTDPIATMVEQQKAAVKEAERANATYDEILRLERNRDRAQNVPVNL